MATTAPFEPQKFEIGRVFGTIFAVIGRNALLYLGFAFLVSAVPQILFQRLMLTSLTPSTGSVPVGDPGAEAVALMYGNIGYFGLFWVVLLVLGALLQSALSRATIEDLSGRTPSPGESLGVAIAVLPQTFALSLLIGIGAGVGLIFLVVPGVLLWLRWCVAIPVLVQERPGVFASMSRSRDLTKGSRWALFGLFLVIFLVIWAISLVMTLITAMTTLLIGPLIGSIVTTGISATITGVLTAAAAAASYVELRRVKEGTGVEELAQIFA